MIALESTDFIVSSQRSLVSKNPKINCTQINCTLLLSIYMFDVLVSLCMRVLKKAYPKPKPFVLDLFE